MTAAEKAALAWLDAWRDTGAMDTCGERHRATLKAMLADRESIWPVLPKEPTIGMRRAMWNGFEPLQRMDDVYRALYAHLTKPHVDFAALDEARMDDEVLKTHAGTGAGATQEARHVSGPVMGPVLEVARVAPPADLRKAISVLRGWSAEAAGRTGLAESVLIVCNAAEATLPRQMYRVRNGAALDVICPGPISISEVDDD